MLHRLRAIRASLPLLVAACAVVILDRPERYALEHRSIRWHRRCDPVAPIGSEVPLTGLLGVQMTPCRIKGCGALSVPNAAASSA